MGKITRPAPVKLISGLIYTSDNAYARAKASLERRFGPADLESQPIPFDFTDHYTIEMGSGLTRRFLSFKRLMDPQRLALIKVWTNRLEEKLSVKGRRAVNIDPGYVDLAKLVLASTKDFCHRIPMGNGIFGEVTLCYQGKSFRSWELTYPDFRTPAYIEF